MKMLDIADQHGTPAYIFDYDKLDQRLRFIRGYFGEKAGYCYAVKANPFLVGQMKKYGMRYEVCSPGEFKICEQAGVHPEQIVLSGVYKDVWDIEYVMDREENIGLYTVESREQLNLLYKAACKYRKQIDIVLRLTSGNQFGMDEELIKEIVRERKQYNYLSIKGLHYYSGTQKKKCNFILAEIEYLDKFCEALRKEEGFTVQELEYGPGLPINYFTSDKEDDEIELMEQISRKLNQLENNYRITLEIGRFMAATCGVYLSKVVDVKRNQNENYCLIDGGIHHINYYGQMFALKMPKIEVISRNGTINAHDKTEWNICGSLCTVGDVLAKKFEASEIRIGDILIFHNAGAYSITEGISLFLSRDLPKVLACSGEKGITVLRDGTPTYTINSSVVSND